MTTGVCSPSRINPCRGRTRGRLRHNESQSQPLCPCHCVFFQARPGQYYQVGGALIWVVYHSGKVVADGMLPRMGARQLPTTCALSATALSDWKALASDVTGLASEARAPQSGERVSTIQDVVLVVKLDSVERWRACDRLGALILTRFRLTCLRCKSVPVS